MKFTAEVKIMPLKDLLDPQGKAVMSGLQKLGISINDVRIGKHIDLQIEAENEAQAREIAEDAARKLLANQVMETFAVSILT
jgi:phosphoribosylformylglycinamidine synthase